VYAPYFKYRTGHDVRSVVAHAEPERSFTRSLDDVASAFLNSKLTRGLSPRWRIKYRQSLSVAKVKPLVTVKG
jgi:hypothetical protein